MNRRDRRLAAFAAYALVVATYLASVASHVLAVSGGTPAPNGTLFHDAAVRFAALGIPFPLLLLLALPALALHFTLLALPPALLHPPPADGFGLALRSHAPLLLLLAHPIAAPFRLENFGRRVALVAAGLSLALYLLGLLSPVARNLASAARAALRAFASALAREVRESVSALRNLPTLFLDHQPLVILTVAALALRLYRIEERSIWWDEFAAFDWNKSTFADLLRCVARYDSHPPLFYVVERFCLQAFGFSILVSRVPMAVASALSVPAVYLLAGRLVAPAAALPAALLAALSPFSVVYGQEARMYGMLLALLAWAAWCLVRAALDGRALPLLAFGVLMSLALHTHYMALPFCAAFLLFPAAAGRPDRTAPVAGALGAALLSLAPWGLVARASPVSGEFARYLTHWIEPYPVDYIARTPVFLFDGPFNPNGMGALALAVLPCLLPLAALREGSGDRRRALALALLCWGPVVTEYALSAALEAATGAAIFNVKHLIGCLPFVLLLLVRAAFAFRAPALRAAFVGGLALLNAAALIQYFQADLNTNWTAAARHLEREAAPGDAVLCVPDLALASLQTYFKPAGGSPEPLAFKPADGSDEVEAADRFFRERLAGARRLHAVIREIGVRHGPLFPRDAALLARIGREFSVAASADFEGTPRVRLLRFERGIGPGSAEVAIVHRFDPSRLYFYRYAVETGLLDDLPVQTMVDGDPAKRPMRAESPGETGGAWRLPVTLAVDGGRERSFHAVLDTGVKSAFLAHYFYVGESIRFSFSGHEEGRVIEHRPATLRDPFARMGRDAALLLLALLSLGAALLPLARPKGDPAGGSAGEVAR